MRLHLFSLALTVALLSLGDAGAADLTKVDRRIRKEPAYESKPKYCLLVFGPEAKHRVWLVLDGDTLYVDRNGNGDLTETGKKVPAPAFKSSDHPAHEKERTIKVGDLVVGALTHTDLEVSQLEYRKKVPPKVPDPKTWQDYLDSIRRQVPDGITYSVSLKMDCRCYPAFADKKRPPVDHFAWLDRGGHLAFASSPKDAPIIHFGGDLTMALSIRGKLQHGDRPDDTTVYVGSQGLGAGTFVHMCHDLIPKDAHPVLVMTSAFNRASALRRRTVAPRMRAWRTLSSPSRQGCATSARATRRLLRSRTFSTTPTTRPTAAGKCRRPTPRFSSRRSVDRRSETPRPSLFTESGGLFCCRWRTDLANQGLL